MAILIGIDEAGYGPLVGPMVMTAITLEVPDEVVGVSLWQVLSGTVTRRPSAARRRTLAIADSKLLYHGLRSDNGLVHLERGVLAALAAGGMAPRTLAELLDLLAPEARAEACRYPWYDSCDSPVPCAVEEPEVADLGIRLARRMAGAGVALREVVAAPVFAGAWNLALESHGDKAAVHFSVAARLLDHLRRGWPEQNLVIHCDRHGGRKRYLAPLLSVFDGCWIWTLDETPHSSSYRVEDGDRRIEIHFTVGCEERQLPVALASMTSKYLRELFIHRLNRFWAEQVPGLSPTAGYYGDGRRFVRDIREALVRLGISESLVLRAR